MPCTAVVRPKTGPLTCPTAGWELAAPLARHICKRFAALTGRDRDELFAEAAYQFVKLFATWFNGNPALLNYLVKRACQRALTRAVAADRRRADSIAHAAAGIDRGRAAAAELEHAAREDVKETTARLLASLDDPADRQLVAERFGLTGQPPMTRPAIAARLGVSPQAVEQREARILTRLRPLARRAGYGH